METVQKQEKLVEIKVEDLGLDIEFAAIDGGRDPLDEMDADIEASRLVNRDRKDRRYWGSPVEW